MLDNLILTELSVTRTAEYVNGLALSAIPFCYVWLLIDSKAKLSSDEEADTVVESRLPHE